MALATSKRKLATAIFMLCIAIVGFVAMTFSILAATTQQVQSVFSVTYSGDNVYALVSATYSLNGGTPQNMKTSDGQISLVFNPGMGLTSKTLSCAEVGLSPENSNLFFVYKFVNQNPSGGTSMQVTFADNSSSTNITTTYFASTTSMPTQSQTEASTTGKNITLVVAAGATGYVAVCVRITSVYQDASYLSTSSSGVNATISSVA